MSDDYPVLLQPPAEADLVEFHFERIDAAESRLTIALAWPKSRVRFRLTNPSPIEATYGLMEQPERVAVYDVSRDQLSRCKIKLEYWSDDNGGFHEVWADELELVDGR